jgi:hypothetical protein
MEPQRPLEILRESAGCTDERPAYSPDGVDLTLIRWMLSLTPAERLQTLQQHVRSILRLRDGQPDA